MRTWLTAAALVAMMAAGAQAQQVAGLGDVSATIDADDFSALRVRGGALLRYETPFQYIGLAAQTTQYAESGWRASAPGVFLLWRRQKAATLEGIAAEAGVVRVSGRMRVVGDATWSLRPLARTGIELIASGDLVGTRRALENAIAYRFTAASIEQGIGKRFTVIGLAGMQHFTDGNERVHLRGRLIYVVAPEQGLSLQLQWRQYESGQLDVGQAYFNPERYRQWHGGLSMRRRSAGWMLSASVAAGREQIDGGAEQTIWLADLRMERAIGRAHLALHAGYNRSAGFGTADDYWDRALGVTIIVPF